MQTSCLIIFRILNAFVKSRQTEGVKAAMAFCGTSAHAWNTYSALLELTSSSSAAPLHSVWGLETPTYMRPYGVCIHNAAALLHTPLSWCAEHKWRKCFWTEGPSSNMSALHNAHRAATKCLTSAERGLNLNGEHEFETCRGRFMQTTSIVGSSPWLRFLAADTRCGLVCSGPLEARKPQTESGPAGCDRRISSRTDASSHSVRLRRVWGAGRSSESQQSIDLWLPAALFGCRAVIRWIMG